MNAVDTEGCQRLSSSLHINAASLPRASYLAVDRQEVEVAVEARDDLARLPVLLQVCACRTAVGKSHQREHYF